MKRLCVSLMCTVLLGGCVVEEDKSQAYRTATVALRDVTIQVEAAGVVEPIGAIEVKSKAAGEILELPVETGQRVTTGELLVKIDQRMPRNTLAQADAALEVARARLENAQAQLARVRKLFERASVSEADLESAELDVANARAEVVRSEVAVENARIAMDDTIVRAPIAGTLIEVLVERGQVISSPGQDVGGGTLLLRMADLDRVQVRALVDETDIGKVASGVPARVTMAAYRDREFLGRVQKVEPQAQAVQNLTMFPVLVELDNRAGLLKPGMNAEIAIDIAHRSQVLTIPNAALRTANDAPSAAEFLGLDVASVDAALKAEQPMAAAPAPAAPPGDVRERMREIRAKRERGEPLTEEEQAFAAQVRARMQQLGGPGARRGPGGPDSSPGGPPGSTPGPGVAGEGPEVDAFAAARRRSGLDEQMRGDYIVFVERASGPAPVRITTGITDLDYTEVIDGLAVGDVVLILPSASLVRAQEGFQERVANRMSSPFGGGGGGPRR